MLHNLKSNIEQKSGSGQVKYFPWNSTEITIRIRQFVRRASYTLSKRIQICILYKKGLIIKAIKVNAMKKQCKLFTTTIKTSTFNITS